MTTFVLGIFNVAVFVVAYKISDTFLVGAITGCLITLVNAVVIRVEEASRDRI